MESNLPAEWRAAPAIQRWSHGLLEQTGLTPAEVEERLAVLFQFCQAHGFSPESMVAECRHHPDKMARREFYLKIAHTTPANLVIQSFLVHNGVNVFGELICMPQTTAQIVAEQGEQWLRHEGLSV